MPYQYSDPSREAAPHALPDVEVFGPDCWADCPSCSVTMLNETWNAGGCPDCGVANDDHHASVDNPRQGYGYAFGLPGCLWDSDPVGPFETEAEALAAAREQGGF